MTKSKIRILGSNIMQLPLLETADARIIEFYDQDGGLMALMIKGVLDPELWGLATKADDDWDTCLIRYGYSKPVQETVQALKENINAATNV